MLLIIYFGFNLRLRLDFFTGRRWHWPDNAVWWEWVLGNYVVGWDGIQAIARSSTATNIGRVQPEQGTIPSQLHSICGPPTANAGIRLLHIDNRRCNFFLNKHGGSNCSTSIFDSWWAFFLFKLLIKIFHLLSFLWKRIYLLAEFSGKISIARVIHKSALITTFKFICLMQLSLSLS